MDYRTRWVVSACITVGALAVAARPAAAGVVYVALAADAELHGTRYVTELKVSNPSGTPRTFTTFFIKTNESGTVRPEGATAIEQTVPPGESRIYRGLAPAATTGMLEINSDNVLVFSARLVPRVDDSDKEGANVPVVSSANLVAGGKNATVLGISRGEDRATTLGLINLSKVENECRVEMVGAQGAALISPAIIRLPPLVQWFFPDLLGFVGREDDSEVRFQLNCQGAAFVFGHSINTETGEVVSLPPATAGDSTLTVPGAPSACPDGALCFTEQGVFHVPSRGNEFWKKKWPIAPGQVFKRLRVQITIQHGGWDRQTPDYIHNVFWLYRNVWMSNTFGYVNLRGPNRNEVTNTTNVNQPAGVIKKTTTKATLTPGQTYKVDYTSDTTAGRIETIVSTLDGTQVARMTDTASAAQIVTEGAGFEMWCGLERIHFEVPTYGWTYSDLSFQLLP